MFGNFNSPIRNNRKIIENRTNMFKGNNSYSTTYGKGSDKPRKELSEKKKKEVRSWTDEFNRKRSLRNITIMGTIILLTAIVVYSILYEGALDFFLNRLPI